MWLSQPDVTGEQDQVSQVTILAGHCPAIILIPGRDWQN